MTVLYLTEPGTTLAARSLVVRHGTTTRARVPVLNLQRVAVLAPAHLTSAAVALCAQEQVELVVMARGGRGLARLGASAAGLELRGAQHRAASVRGVQCANPERTWSPQQVRAGFVSAYGDTVCVVDGSRWCAVHGVARRAAVGGSRNRCRNKLSSGMLGCMP